jgi:hypothetical protein
LIETIVSAYPLSNQYGSTKDFDPTRKVKYPHEWVVDQSRFNRACKRIGTEAQELLSYIPTTDEEESPSTEEQEQTSQQLDQPTEDQIRSPPETETFRKNSVASAEYTISRPSVEPTLNMAQEGGEQEQSGFTDQ